MSGESSVVDKVNAVRPKTKCKAVESAIRGSTMTIYFCQEPHGHDGQHRQGRKKWGPK